MSKANQKGFINPTAIPDDRASSAADSIGLGGGTFIGLNRSQLLAALGRYAGAMVRHPRVLLTATTKLAAEQVEILAGRSEREPELKDRRFSDESWRRPGWRQLTQSYLAFRETVMATTDQVDLDEASAERARFGLMQITEAMAPSNNLLTNPVATRKARDTRGQSLVAGARHLVWDVRNNGGLPSQVDTRPFILGETTAATPGSVIRRTQLYELIQYAPQTEEVATRPVVIIPPQINRYYFLDLAPERSFVEHAVKNGQQVFIMSWRNPGPEHRTWSLDGYVNAALDAIETVRSVADVDDVNLVGFCSGGITESILLGYLAAQERRIVNSATLAVTLIDSHIRSVLNSFATRESVASTIERSRKKGMLEGEQLARVFAWVRPNDLVWNYWVSNYLLGESPPAFDVLAWNADATSLPNQLHEQFIELSLENGLMTPGGVTVLGLPIDLGKVDVDVYSVGAITDHLVSWQAAYAATQVFGGQHRFVLSNSGHIQALVNPPGNPKASFYVGDDYPANSQEWLDNATKTPGSWWTDWLAWLEARSGDRKPALARLGNDKHEILCAAPGTYVTS